MSLRGVAGTHRRASRVTRLRALWSSVFWGSVGVGAYLLGVWSVFGQVAEATVLDAASYTTSPPPPLNLVSLPTVVIALVVISILAWIVHGPGRAVRVGLLSLLAIVSSQLLKQQLLSRPELFELDAPNTFPSGHMTVFVALLAALIWAVPGRLRAVVTVIGAVVLAAVAWQLLAYGWHRPSDVLGALALGVLAFTVPSIVWPARGVASPEFGRVALVGLAILGWSIALGGVVLACIASLRGMGSLLLTAGQFGVIGASLIAARSLLSLSTLPESDAPGLFRGFA